MAKELDIKFATPLLAQLAEDLAEKLGSGKRQSAIFNRHMEAALKQALKPGVKLLKNATPKGPTGNLKRSVTVKTKSYRKDRRWWGAVGYSAKGDKASKIGKDGRRRGSDLGYHQGLVEFGTGVRQFGKWTGGSVRVGSSISLTPGLNVSTSRGGVLKTKPGPPKGFFKSARAGQTVEVAPMKAQRNIPKVYGMADDFMEAALREDMKTRVEKAVSDLKKWNERSPQ